MIEWDVTNQPNMVYLEFKQKENEGLDFFHNSINAQISWPRLSQRKKSIFHAIQT